VKIQVYDGAGTFAGTVLPNGDIVVKKPGAGNDIRNAMSAVPHFELSEVGVHEGPRRSTPKPVERGTAAWMALIGTYLTRFGYTVRIELSAHQVGVGAA